MTTLQKMEFITDLGRCSWGRLAADGVTLRCVGISGHGGDHQFDELDAHCQALLPNGDQCLGPAGHSGGHYSHDLPLCGSPLTKDGVMYACRQIALHDGAHRWWDEYNNKLVWGPEANVIFSSDEPEFVEPPYNDGTKACLDLWFDASGVQIMCCKPPGHAGQHGNPNGDEGIPVYWINSAPIGAWGAYTPAPKGQAAFEIVIPTAQKAIPSKIRLNGLELPNVKSVTVEYETDAPRVVIVEIIATDVEEVAQ